MRFSKPEPVEIWGFVISMPFIELAWNAILYDERVFTDAKVWTISAPLIYGIAIVSWYLHIQYDHLIRRLYPELSQTKKRVLFKIPTNILVMTPSVLFIFYLYDVFHIAGYRLRTEDLKWGYLTGLCINVIFDTLWEILYSLQKYKESLSEKEALEQLNAEHHFESLKSQVNPHFLFNCFNTLSSLIQEDKREAVQFLDELSKVYRYLLKNNEESISTVEKEVKFIESYCQLLKTRYGDGLHMNINISRHLYSYLLPSLTLQLLVENAVKHNIVSRQQPLMLEIFTTAGNKLVVNNNLQRKQLNKTSTGIGLSNIKAKYRLVKQDGFKVVEGKQNFMVVLPLMFGNGEFTNKK